MASKVKKDFIELTWEELDLVEKYILDIPCIGIYNDENTPLDNFDSKCHDCKDGYKSAAANMSDHEFMFLINTAEHINRPVDMLMLLGEYFKIVIIETNKVNDNI